jgi:glucose/arabinose dehydrogenase
VAVDLPPQRRAPRAIAHRRLIARAALVLVPLAGPLGACGEGAPGSGQSFPPDSLLRHAVAPADSPRGPAGAPVRLDTIASGLAIPWDLAFAPDGRVFVTERGGRIRVIANGDLAGEPWATLDVVASAESWTPESGLLGIALAPDFATSGHVFVIGTFWKTDSARSRGIVRRIWRQVAGTFSAVAGSPYETRIVRFTDRDGRGRDPVIVVRGLPAHYSHDGGALAFGPDGMLYATVGDITVPRLAQRRGVAAGKVLRFHSDGSIPPDNPDADSPVWALGLRNAQSLAWHPETGDLFATEHGPTGMPQEGGREGHDELNHIVPGANYGWPRMIGIANDAPPAQRGTTTGATPPSDYAQPIRVWATAIAPRGAAFYTGPHEPWKHNLFVGGLRSMQLRRLELTNAGGTWRVTADEPMLVGALGRIRAVRMGPGGYLYFATSNHDGRGVPRAGDDLLLRLRP